MNEVTDSRLFLKSKQYDTPVLKETFIATIKSCGIDEDRLRFEGMSPHDELLGKNNEVDGALDPWPYSGGLTTCEALWMGVPVVTKPGPTFAGRHSTTHLINAGLPELVADSWHLYRQKIVELAQDQERLSELRNGLREQVKKSPLFDGERFGANLSTALRAAWHQWVDGHDKGKNNWQSHIDVEPMEADQIERSAKTEKPSHRDEMTTML